MHKVLYNLAERFSQDPLETLQTISSYPYMTLVMSTLFETK